MKNLITKEEKDRIDLICKKYKIENYTINSDGSIDVKGDVDLFGEILSTLPLRFGKVDGFFVCSFNLLTTLEGSPHTLGGDFICNDNKLSSLVGCPITVGGEFVCFRNQLTSLEGSPTTIGGNLFCTFNAFSSLVGCPTTIGGNFNYSHNNITSTYTGETDVEISGKVLCTHTNLPEQLKDNMDHMKIILKYQRHFYIWNDDLTLNEENFQTLLGEIKDGLL